MIGFATFVAWGVIFALSLMMVGGMVLWAYGARTRMSVVTGNDPEAHATRLFHTKLSRWFFSYGVTVIIVGAAILLWAYSIFN